MSCPYHGRFRSICSRICHYQLQRMSLTGQEAEEEIMQTAISMSIFVLREPNEMLYQEELQRLNELHRQEELDRELAIALTNFDRSEQGFVRPTQLPPQRIYRVYRIMSIDLFTVDRELANSIAGGFVTPGVRSNGAPTNHRHNIQPVEDDFSLFAMNDPAQSSHYGLHPMYHNYRTVPVQFSEEYQWPASAVYKQLEELNIYRGCEDIVEWQEGQPKNHRCPICLTNVATRMAVPCGHKLSCRQCIGRVLTTTDSNKSYLYPMPNGEYVAVTYEIPIRCLICRCIVGMIVVIH